MTTVKMSSKNQVVVPKEAREQMGVGPGDEFIVISKRDRMVFLRKPKDLFLALRGSAKGIYGDVDEYLRKERDSWKSGSRRL